MTYPTNTNLPDGWPALSLKQIEAKLCAPGQRFEMETVDLDGKPVLSWKYQPPTLPFLARIARSHGNRVFTIYENERITYEAWFKATAALAEFLQKTGVKKGDRVALSMRNLPEWPVVFFAAASLGAIVVPLNAWWTGSELQYALQDSGSSILVCDAERLDRIAPLRHTLPALKHVVVNRSNESLNDAISLESVIGSPADYHTLPELDLPQVEIVPDDNATIFYTSGTTGKPKGALGTHRNIMSCVMANAYVGQRGAMRRGEMPKPSQPRVALAVIPLFHVTACNSTLMSAIGSGSTLVFMHKFEPVRAFELIQQEKVNIAGGVPTIAWQLLEHPDRNKYDLSSLDTITYGGAPAAPELVRRIRDEFGATPGSGWGMTETSAAVTMHNAEDYLNRPDSCGPPLPVSELKIMDPEGNRELPIGEVGELWARGPQIVKGYWNNPEATQAAFVDGWVKTGDLARLDKEGFCYIVDRAKDIVIRGGENIYSTEVENALYNHPAVVDAALIGVPHQTLGEIPAAVVQLRDGHNISEDELQAFVREQLAAFKVPAEIRFSADPLPRNANGKILKRELRPLFTKSKTSDS